jgi:hypothetical protein
VILPSACTVTSAMPSTSSCLSATSFTSPSKSFVGQVRDQVGRHDDVELRVAHDVSFAAPVGEERVGELSGEALGLL